jgi:hypothetical protein
MCNITLHGDLLTPVSGGLGSVYSTGPQHCCSLCSATPGAVLGCLSMLHGMRVLPRLPWLVLGCCMTRAVSLLAMDAKCEESRALKCGDLQEVGSLQELQI